MQSTSYQDLKFSEAALLWLESQRPYLKTKTHQHYEFCIGSLNRVMFRDLRLRDIHAGHLAEYQQLRSRPEERPVKMRGGEVRPKLLHAGPRTINHELNALSQILARAGLWAALEDFYRPLPLPKWEPPKVITQKEEDHFFEVASHEIFDNKNPEWLVAYCCSSIMVNTGMRGGELRGLRLRHVDVGRAQIFVPPELAKTPSSVRIVALNDIAMQHLRWLLILARERGSFEPDHYLLPFRLKRGKYDPTRPTKGWRTAWRKMVATAGLPKTLTPHCLRHQFITKGLENPEISEHTMMAQVGHISQQILNHYSHTRLEAKRQAVDLLAPKNGKPVRGVEAVSELFTGKAKDRRKNA